MVFKTLLFVSNIIYNKNINRFNKSKEMKEKNLIFFGSKVYLHQTKSIDEDYLYNSIFYKNKTIRSLFKSPNYYLNTKIYWQLLFLFFFKNTIFDYYLLKI